ncbi:homocitrate synthase [Colletotrichum karsti]|uniref:Homocitrate synthase n=1 Tax=Colletotrichum karsti TaxID=1095194 RepID=A0A9P6I1E1_9PEZI|nr:homocitrate synthase [Colletotrichum karsti]KAF9874474.1 homocitrate synthase [Colletotrichum karsti]
MGVRIRTFEIPFAQRLGCHQKAPDFSKPSSVRHLLGKKSWNVYNADNIARVRRDEAAAKAKEEAEEQRMQDVDAERRLAILRGEEPPPLPPPEVADAEPRARDRDAGLGRERKKRKRAGEDDTEFELRVAKERSDVVQAANDTLRKSTSSAPIVDRAGHIDLFGEERKQGRHLKNEEAEKESAKKKKELEDQYTMRFSNAAGRDGMVGPWYAKSESRDKPAELEPPSKDVWGNEDPGRKKRDAERIVASDPLAMMKSGAARVREVKKERQKLEAERQKDLEQLRKEEKRKERHERRRDQRKESDRHSRDNNRDDRERRDRKDGERGHRRRDSDRHRDDDRRRTERRSDHREDRKGEERSRRRDRSREDRGHRREHERHDKDSTSRRRDDHKRRDNSLPGNDDEQRHEA